MSRLAVALITLGTSVCAYSLPLEAQPTKPKVVCVGFNPLPVYEASFDSTLRGLGWEDGRNLLLEWHYIRPGQSLAEMVTAAIGRAPEVLVVPSAGVATAFRVETISIPIVVIAAGELVGNTGLAESLARPGGNVTGTQIVQQDLIGKRLQLLKEALPHVTRMAALQETATVSPKARAAIRKVFETQARVLGIEPLWYEVGRLGEFDDRFRAMAGHRVHAVIVIGSPFMLKHAGLLAELAAKYHVPATYEIKDHVHAGGLMSYGIDLADLFVRAGVFVDRILRGAKPGLLPIEQPRKFEFTVNLRAAKTLGLTIPQSVLQRADEVIE